MKTSVWILFLGVCLGGIVLGMYLVTDASTPAVDAGAAAAAAPRTVPTLAWIAIGALAALCVYLGISLLFTNLWASRARSRRAHPAHHIPQGEDPRVAKVKQMLPIFERFVKTVNDIEPAYPVQQTTVRPYAVDGCNAKDEAGDDVAVPAWW